MNKNHPHYAARLAVPVIIFYVFVAFGLKRLGSADMSLVFRWWLTLLAIGVVFQPLTLLLFKKFHDCGWAFSKVLGIAAAGWLLWLLSAAHILKFTRFGCVVALLLALGLNVLAYYYGIRRRNRKAKFSDFYSIDKVCSIVTSEVAFFVILVFWCYMRGVAANLNGAEKLMDFGYMKSLSETKYMPAKDLWFSGEALNSTYFGQYLMAFLSKLSGVDVECGYNIAMAMLASMGIVLSYSVGSNLMLLFLRDRADRLWSPDELRTARELGAVGEEHGRPYFRPAFAGAVSAIAVAVAGTLSYTHYEFIYQKYQRIDKQEQIYSYLYTAATRLFGNSGDYREQTPFEFPGYSYTLGDLASHVINLIFVLTFLALMISWIRGFRRQLSIVRRYGAAPKLPVLLNTVFSPELMACAALLGIFRVTNRADYAIYLVIAVLLILFTNLVLYANHTDRGMTLRATVFQTAMLVGMSIIVAFPILLGMSGRSGSVNVAFTDSELRTPFSQWLLRWGLPTVAILSYVVFLIAAYIRAKGKKNREAVPAELRKYVDPDADGANGVIPRRSAFLRFFAGLEAADLFVLITGLSALLMVILREIIVVSGSVSGYRFDQMYKLTYQAFILFALAMAFLVIRYLSMPKSPMMLGFGVVIGLLLFSTAGYAGKAYSGRFTGKYAGLDATAYYSKISSTDVAFINYLNNLTEKPKTILEMTGPSYSTFGRISAFTGIPSVLGWKDAEMIQREGKSKDYNDSVYARYDDIITLYTSDDNVLLSALIEKYDIDYIVVGRNEAVDGWDEVTSEDIRNGKVAANQAITIENGRRWRALVPNTSTLLTLGQAMLSSGDDTEGTGECLIRVNRKITSELAQQYNAAGSGSSGSCASPAGTAGNAVRGGEAVNE